MKDIAHCNAYMSMYCTYSNVCIYTHTNEIRTRYKRGAYNMKKSPFPTYPYRNPKFFFIKRSRVCDGRICDISKTTTIAAKTIIYRPTNTVPVSLTEFDSPIPSAPTTLRKKWKIYYIHVCMYVCMYVCKYFLQIIINSNEVTVHIRRIYQY